MKAILFTFLSVALVCGSNAAFGQSKDKPFGDTNTKVVELKVTGMTCQGCADQVTSALSEKKGVVKSDVKFSENSASVTYDPATITETEIIKTVEDTGFKAEPVKKSTKKDELKTGSTDASSCCAPKKKT
ncbi:MAG: heavy-metal-associated domain-containing protein [Cyclobacteriaceae bacterium]|jgi:copper chaperone CopZ|nr:heavy-metal-associated domain-containing protein [Cytophagales bacterium]MBX2914485.1 heavy-metal-associated domain-containing protein [Cyclobacteriaceae bacterium]